MFTEKLLDYVSYDTTSDESSESCPSTPNQLVLGAHLKDQLLKMGIEDASQDENGYVYGSLPGSDDYLTIGLIAHMDTSDQSCGANIKPRVIENYDGEDIVLNDKVTTSVERFPNLKRYKGKTLIVTDGNTLLGADDKAGVAIIMEVLEFYVSHPKVKHGTIRVAFTPDEEIGRGADRFNYDLFKVDFAYTLDGAAPNEIEYENFNAAAAHVEITGVSVHPGSAKDIMVNAINVAHRFHGMLPTTLRPETTEGYEGFNHLGNITGTVERASMDYIIRNHNLELLEKQKAGFVKIAEYLNTVYPEGTVKVEIRDQYRNMREKFEGHMEPIELARKAMNKVGMNYEEVAIRGGTDGASLTWGGILCPNLGTGGQNFHGVHEFCCVEDANAMIKLVIILLNMATK